MKVMIKIGRHEWTGEIVKEGKRDILIKTKEGTEIRANRRTIVWRENASIPS